MAYSELAEFLEQLEQTGQLVRIEASVRCEFEVGEISRRVAAARGPALLFGSVQGSPWPLVTNLLGTEARIALALGAPSLQAVADRLSEAVGWAGAEAGRSIWGAGWLPARRHRPKALKSGSCQDVVRSGTEVDLTALPALQLVPQESGRMITAGYVVTAEPDTGQRLLARCDLRIVDRSQLAPCWFDHEELAAIYRRYAERHLAMPVAVVLGGDPAAVLAAWAWRPWAMDGFSLAGLFRQKAIETVACRSVELEVPAEADFVIEGVIEPGSPWAPEATVVAPSGYLRTLPASPVLHVTALTHRANPVFPALARGRPPHEEVVVTRALQRVQLPWVQRLVPELVDYEFPESGAGRHIGYVAIRKGYAGQAWHVAHALWGLAPGRFAKLLVIVDDDVPVGDADAVWAAVGAHADLSRDVLVTEGPADPWDPAGPSSGCSRRVAVDATRKLPGESSAPSPLQARAPEEVRQRVCDRWSEYGLETESGPP